MVPAGHMDGNYEIFGKRKVEEKEQELQARPVVQHKVKKVKVRKEPTQDIWELTGGVVTGMVCVASYTFLMAALC